MAYECTQAQVFLASNRIKTTRDVWHLRLGHPSPPLLQSIISKNSLPVAATSLDFQKPFFCSDCHINKSHKMPFQETSIASTRPLQFVFSDVWSSPVFSHDNNKYYVIFVDHYSRYTWLYPLQKKSQVKDVFLAFKPLVENHFQTKIGTLFSDNGGEYIALRSYLQTHGISHLTSLPHTPEHNASLNVNIGILWKLVCRCSLQPRFQRPTGLMRLLLRFILLIVFQHWCLQINLPIRSY